MPPRSLHRQDRCPLKAPGLQFLQRPVCFFKWKMDRMRFDRDRCRFAQQVEPVLSGVGRDTADDALPEDVPLEVLWGRILYCASPNNQLADESLGPSTLRQGSSQRCATHLSMCGKARPHSLS
jgi:hypothetical protein